VHPSQKYAMIFFRHSSYATCASCGSSLAPASAPLPSSSPSPRHWVIHSEWVLAPVLMNRTKRPARTNRRTPKSSQRRAWAVRKYIGPPISMSSESTSRRIVYAADEKGWSSRLSASRLIFWVCE